MYMRLIASFMMHVWFFIFSLQLKKLATAFCVINNFF